MENIMSHQLTFRANTYGVTQGTWLPSYSPNPRCRWLKETTVMWSTKTGIQTEQCVFPQGSKGQHKTKEIQQQGPYQEVKGKGTCGDVPNLHLIILASKDLIHSEV